MSGTVEITQFMRPDGRPVKQSLAVDDPTLCYCLLIRESGYWFECEVLMDGSVSMTITDDDADHAIRLISKDENKSGGFDAAFAEMTRKFSDRLLANDAP